MATFTHRTLPNPAVAVAVLVGLILAVVLGVYAGIEDMKVIGGFAGIVVTLVVVLTMRTSIWLLIPAFWGLTGRISILPLPFNVRDLSVMLAGGMCLIFYALKVLRQKPIYDWRDLVLGANLGYLMISYFRNPVGLAFMRSENVGGRPYFNIAIGVVAFLVLHRVAVGPERVRLLPWLNFGPHRRASGGTPKPDLIPLLLLGASAVVSLLGVLTQFVPALVPVIAPFYSGISLGTYMAEEYGKGASLGPIGSERIDSLGILGLASMTYAAARWNPSTLLNPMSGHRFLVFLFSIGCTLLSGFRSMTLQIMGFFIIAAFLHGGWGNVIRNGILGFAAMLVLGAAQGTFFELPMTMQRALSWLPGNWSENARRQAVGSNEWRMDMWRVALTTDRYIKNKVWGDGFGFSMANFKIMLDKDFGGGGFLGPDSDKENFMIQGSFHSGPVSAIRFVGVVGLAFHLTLLGTVAFYAFRLCKESRDTPYAFAGRFFAIGALYEPFHFVVVAGSYDSNVPQIIFYLGVLKMFDLSVRKYRASLRTPAPPPVPVARQRGRLRLQGPRPLAPLAAHPSAAQKFRSGTPPV